MSRAISEVDVCDVLTHADHLAAADDRDAAGDCHHLLELVRDEDDRDLSGGETAEEVEELFGFLRRENSGRLVEDEEGSLSVEHLQDFHPLLRSQGKVTDTGVPGEGDVQLAGDLLHPAARPGPIHYDAAPWLGAKDDVLQGAHRRNELEALVDHADPGLDGVRGTSNPHRLSPKAHLAFIRLLQPIEDPHEGSLSSSVLSHQGVDLPLLDGKVDLVVGHDAGESLGDPLQLEIGHWGRAQPL